MKGIRGEQDMSSPPDRASVQKLHHRQACMLQQHAAPVRLPAHAFPLKVPGLLHQVLYRQQCLGDVL